MYPTSMAEKLPFACFRLSEQSDMCFAQILPGCDGGVKAPRRGVGKHLFPVRTSKTLSQGQKVACRDTHDLRGAPRHETPCRPRRDGEGAARQNTTIPPHPAGPQY